MIITGTTRVLGIIGDPVSHSRSPEMQNRALAAVGFDYVYVPFHVRPEQLAEAVAGFRASGVHGFNVTVPHKVAVAPLMDRLSPEAEQIGAVNTVHNENGKLVGYNTDGFGLVTSLREELGFEPHGADLIVVGAGGAARAAVHALCSAGAGRIVIINRTVAKAGELAEKYRKLFPGSRLDVCQVLPTSRAEYDLLLNTTSIGMDGISLSADPTSLDTDAVVYDMIYAPSETPLLAAAKRRGLRFANGLGMLAAQGERAFTIWTGVTPPQGLMKAVLQETVRQF
jgi:shikimate dehydrogenase